MNVIHKLKNRRLLLGALLLVLGALLVAGLQFATFKDDHVHYHANFALYINGQRDEFKSFTFYEEVQACTSEDKNNPKDRVHMHDHNNGVIHIHAPAVTWGHFLANLGYSLGDKVLQTDNGVLVDGQSDNKLIFILNGQAVTSLANRLINSEDRLLINYGNDDQQILNQRFDTVPSDARQKNTEHDPPACSGSSELTTWQRIKKAFIN